MKLMINCTSAGFGVYDADKMDRLDLFPNTQEGRERLVDFLAKFVHNQRPRRRRSNGARTKQGNLRKI